MYTFDQVQQYQNKKKEIVRRQAMIKNQLAGSKSLVRQGSRMMDNIAARSTSQETEGHERHTSSLMKTNSPSPILYLDHKEKGVSAFISHQNVVRHQDKIAASKSVEQQGKSINQRRQNRILANFSSFTNLQRSDSYNSNGWNPGTFPSLTHQNTRVQQIYKEARSDHLLSPIPADKSKLPQHPDLVQKIMKGRVRNTWNKNVVTDMLPKTHTDSHNQVMTQMSNQSLPSVNLTSNNISKMLLSQISDINVGHNSGEAVIGEQHHSISNKRLSGIQAPESEMRNGSQSKVKQYKMLKDLIAGVNSFKVSEMDVRESELKSNLAAFEGLNSYNSQVTNQAEKRIFRSLKKGQNIPLPFQNEYGESDDESMERGEIQDYNLIISAFDKDEPTNAQTSLPSNNLRYTNSKGKGQQGHTHPLTGLSTSISQHLNIQSAQGSTKDNEETILTQKQQEKLSYERMKYQLKQRTEIKQKETGMFTGKKELTNLQKRKTYEKKREWRDYKHREQKYLSFKLQQATDERQFMSMLGLNIKSVLRSAVDSDEGSPPRLSLVQSHKALDEVVQQFEKQNEGRNIKPMVSNLKKNISQHVEKILSQREIEENENETVVVQKEEVLQETLKRLEMYDSELRLTNSKQSGHYHHHHNHQVLPKIQTSKHVLDFDELNRIAQVEIGFIHQVIDVDDKQSPWSPIKKRETQRSVLLKKTMSSIERLALFPQISSATISPERIAINRRSITMDKIKLSQKTIDEQLQNQSLQIRMNTLEPKHSRQLTSAQRRQEYGEQTREKLKRQRDGWEEKYNKLLKKSMSSQIQEESESVSSQVQTFGGQSSTKKASQFEDRESWLKQINKQKEQKRNQYFKMLLVGNQENQYSDNGEPQMSISPGHASAILEGRMDQFRESGFTKAAHGTQNVMSQQMKGDMEADIAKQSFKLPGMIADQQYKGPIISLVQMSDKQSSLGFNKTNHFDHQDGCLEGLLHNGRDLPEDYLIAKLSLDKKEASQYRKIIKQKDKQIDERRQTGFHFNKADIYNSTGASFNRNIKSEEPDIGEIKIGLQMMVKSFQNKTNFFKAVRKGNGNQTKVEDEERELQTIFVQNASNYGNLPLPVMLKIKKGVLYVPRHYVVTEGVASAMSASLQKLYIAPSSQVKWAILDSNKMTDVSLSKVLIGFLHCPDFCGLTLTSNEIGAFSSHYICKMLNSRYGEKPVVEEIAYVTEEDVEEGKEDTKKPVLAVAKVPEEKQWSKIPEFHKVLYLPQLISLTLSNCRCDSFSMSRILNSIQDSYSLQRLSLSGMDLSGRQLVIFFRYLKKCNLSFLDLSWVKVPRQFLHLLFEALENNTSLEGLNLGWVQMQDCGDDVLDKHFPKFCSFVKENQRLMHLNMTSVSLPPKHLTELISNLKRSQSLHCVHLCGNALNEKITTHLQQKLKPKTLQKSIKQANILAFLKQIKETYQERYEKIYDSVRYKEVMTEWQSLKSEYGYTEGLQETKETEFKQLILTKMMGHNEIVNARYWKQTSDCFMCDKWKYTLIFWDVSSTGAKFQIQDPGLEDLVKEMINENGTLKTLKKEGKIKAGTGKAFILGSFTGWTPRKMLQIDEFCAKLEKKEDALLDFDRRQFYSDQIKSRWRQILRSKSQYDGVSAQYIDMPSPDQFTASNPPDIKFNQLFVYADFVRPGKHEYVVSYESKVVQAPPRPLPEPEQEGDSGRASRHRITLQRKKTKMELEMPPFEPMVSEVCLTSYHQFIGEPLQGGYRVNTKINEFDSVDRMFSKDGSVWKQWKEDRQSAVEEGFLEEVATWKVPNFVKDPMEQLEILDLMKAEASFLKTLFIIRTSQSAYPALRWLSYSPLVQEWEITSEDFGVGEIDRIYLSVTKNLDKSLIGLFPEAAMSRFQFYESLVRIAFFKYKQTGRTPSTAEGVKVLLEVLRRKYDNYSWQGWRAEELWTLENDDLMKTNMNAMRKLYAYYHKAKKSKTYTLEDAIDMFTRDVPLELLPEQISQAWGLSQMTVYNEFKHRKLYFEATLAEFVEVFARLALAKFKEGPHKSLGLTGKIELLMDLSFPLVNAKRKAVQIEVQYQSQSEDELDEQDYLV